MNRLLSKFTWIGKFGHFNARTEFRKKSNWKWLFFLFFIFSQASATEYAPWFGPAFLPEIRLSSAYQGFNEIDSNRRHHVYPGNDFFADLSVSLAIDPIVLWPVSVELESILARTHHRTFGFDCFKVTGRYQWLDDIVGDPVSLTSGISMIFPFRRGLEDLSSFHHGCFEYEGHAAVGREMSCGDRWIFRQYLMTALGSSDRGSPWLRGGYYFETKLCVQYALEVFVEGLMGFGKRALHRDHFQGYGAIRHRSIEAGAKLSYQFDYEGVLSLEYRRRLYARNFPKEVNWVEITFLYPFGIGSKL